MPVAAEETLSRAGRRNGDGPMQPGPTGGMGTIGGRGAAARAHHRVLSTSVQAARLAQVCQRTLQHADGCSRLADCSAVLRVTSRCCAAGQSVRAPQMRLEARLRKGSRPSLYP
eukprot:453460-Prymnesium_polylepis.1